MENTTRSVLQNWVMELPLRAQGTLLVALRGCDLATKIPLDSQERKITAALRGTVMVPADPREVDSEPGCFMLSEPPEKIRMSAWDHFPVHWVLHVMQAVEVIGYLHPYADVRFKWLTLYYKMVKGIHLEPETRERLLERMLEDRIQSGTIVS
jgi:hypothetical protein